VPAAAGRKTNSVEGCLNRGYVAWGVFVIRRSSWNGRRVGSGWRRSKRVAEDFGKLGRRLAGKADFLRRRPTENPIPEDLS